MTGGSWACGARVVVVLLVGLLVRLPALAIVGVLTVYRLLVSPMYGQTCRFYPSCSAYALEAVQRHGAAKGSWLAVRRLGRCHPWNPGGVDPVPPTTDDLRTTAPTPASCDGLPAHRHAA